MVNAATVSSRGVMQSAVTGDSLRIGRGFGQQPFHDATDGGFGQVGIPCHGPQIGPAQGAAGGMVGRQIVDGSDNRRRDPAFGNAAIVRCGVVGLFHEHTQQPYAVVKRIQLSLHKVMQQAPAPVVIGHPDTDAPAYGWVESLLVQGGILKATLEDTTAEFADMVKAGRYKRVSITMYLPRTPNNPKPGKFYLKHVGFLGSAAPAVPGLKPVRFAGSPSDSYTIQQDRPGTAAFAAGDELMRLRRQMREFEVEKLVLEGRVLPVFKDEVISFAASLDDSQTVSFSEGGGATTRKDWFMSYLAKQLQVVSFGEMDLGADPLTTPRKPTASIPDGYQVDKTNAAVAFAAERIAKERGISYVDAVDLVMEGRT